MKPRKEILPDVCDLLDDDHKAVRKMFLEFRQMATANTAGSVNTRKDLAMRICAELTMHATVEEEILYPALRKEFRQTLLLAEAQVEHAGARDLIAQIRSANEVNEMFDAKVMVLGENVDHHVKQERIDIFPKARATSLDLVAMRKQVTQRKEELRAALATPA
ncbi:hemerythrin domain-containing protein [Caenimonas sp. SL110]|uniref:hemerythrin domain-containing protein n=1 Tax=Caenimonas sp. SL110 TaxID=1450524 RepID=UPI0006528FA1|nr:hemerythrin domain-containing protein [Caenimonas sp. SL110]